MKLTASDRQCHLTLIPQAPPPAEPAPSGNLEVLAAHIQREAYSGRTPRVSVDALQALWACGMARAAVKAVSA